MKPLVNIVHINDLLPSSKQAEKLLTYFETEETITSSKAKLLLGIHIRRELISDLSLLGFHISEQFGWVRQYGNDVELDTIYKLLPPKNNDEKRKRDMCLMARYLVKHGTLSASYLRDRLGITDILGCVYELRSRWYLNIHEGIDLSPVKHLPKSGDVTYTLHGGEWQGVA
jgi:hypothetical protein